MDLFLTSGGRSIPKTVLLDDNGEVLGTWGPRPEEAMDLVKRIKSDPAIAHTYSQEVHRWYTQDGTQATQAELAVLWVMPKDLEPEDFTRRPRASSSSRKHTTASGVIAVRAAANTARTGLTKTRAVSPRNHDHDAS